MTPRPDFAPDPPSGWRAWVKERGSVFMSIEWQSNLCRTLGAMPVYAWDPELGRGVVLTVFGRGPLNVAYLGFPVAPEHLDRSWVAAVAQGVRNGHLPVRIDMLRIPASAFVRADRLGPQATTTPETAIPDLPAWPPSGDRRLGRQVHLAVERCSELTIAEDAGRGAEAFALYRQMLRLRRGRRRYSRGYFEGVFELSRRHDRLRCASATLDGELLGFAVVALEGQVAFDLHGVSALARSRLRVSDRLVVDGIEWARSRGARCYNLMSSPPGATGLVRYKEKWGAVTRQMPTYWQAFTVRGRALSLVWS